MTRAIPRLLAVIRPHRAAHPTPPAHQERAARSDLYDPQRQRVKAVRNVGGPSITSAQATTEGTCGGRD